MVEYSNKLILLLLAALFAGCGDVENEREKIASGYGRKAGSNYVNSVNGTAVFSQMIEASGDSIARAESLSPRMDKFERIVWFRDRYEAPTEEVIVALETWLQEGFDRQVIVVGRDYDSAIDYWAGVVQKAKGDDLIEARRRLARAKADFQKRRTGTAVENASCKWFQIAPNDYEPASRANGDWADIFDVSKADLKVGAMLEHPPVATSTPWSERYEVDVELALDSRPMVTRLSRNDFNRGSIRVVSNASFLTNYGLVNHENRKIAQHLIDSKSFNGRTLFLETGDSDARVLTSKSGHLTWAWISKPPLRYMVPHFLLLGIFFCFVLFPIFGRARRADPEADQFTFRDHIRAMGKLMSRSNNLGFAKDKINKYLNRNRKEQEK